MGEKDEYLFGSVHDLGTELGRLRLMQGIYDPLTVRNLEGTGVTGGWDCLEVGAGAGSIAAWLAGRVSPAGSVTALDLNTAYLDETAKLPGVSVVEANIVQSQLGTEVADLIHARAVLCWIDQRGEVLAKLAAALRPGGWLVLEEPGDPIQRVPLNPDYPAAADFDALWDRLMA